MEKKMLQDEKVSSIFFHACNQVYDAQLIWCTSWAGIRIHVQVQNLQSSKFHDDSSTGWRFWGHDGGSIDDAGGAHLSTIVTSST